MTAPAVLDLLLSERARLAEQASVSRFRLEGFDLALAIISEAGAASAESEATEPAPDDDPPVNSGKNWGEEHDAELERLLKEGLGWAAIGTALGRTPVAVKIHAVTLGVYRLYSGRRAGPKGPQVPGAEPGAVPDQTQRRFAGDYDLDPERVTGLSASHRACVNARTLFPRTVVMPADSPRLLVSGHNSRKLGKTVTKGLWSGFPIFMLTLEERASCPETCHHWQTCFGNGMPLARRHVHGPELEARLEEELTLLQETQARGFVVRLHQLGDFYSVDYVARWAAWLQHFPALRIFGYTAWPESTDIGAAVAHLRAANWERFAVRTSRPHPGPYGASTLWRKPEAAKVPEGIVCPAQTGRTECCATCGLCWHPNARKENIVLVAHGRKTANGAARPAAAENGLEGARESDRDGALRFDGPKNRRCACGRIFTTDIVAERSCPECRPTRRRLGEGGEAAA